MQVQLEAVPLVDVVARSVSWAQIDTSGWIGKPADPPPSESDVVSSGGKGEVLPRRCRHHPGPRHLREVVVDVATETAVAYRSSLTQRPTSNV